MPNTHVTLFLGSTFLGSVLTNGAGDFSVPEMIPFNAPLGSTDVKAVGTNMLGGYLVLYAHLIIVPAVHKKTPTTTKFYESQSSANYGNENSVAFTVVVTPDYGPSGGPSGDPVTISVGSTSCVATLFHGAGNCSIGASALPIGGPYAVSATFAGDFRFGGSSSTNPLNFAVTGKSGTTTTVSESRSFGIYGQENAVGFTAHVKPTSGGFGSGLNGDPVTINIGTASCVATLFHGYGTCTIGSDALPVGGPYPVTATFAGDASYGGSTSTNTVDFTVGKAPQFIHFGQLSSERLSQSPVTVSANASSGLPVSFTTSTPTVCSSTGVNGATIKLLQAGTCTVVASQSGGGSFNPASPVSQSFTVLTNFTPPPRHHHHGP